MRKLILILSICLFAFASQGQIQMLLAGSGESAPGVTYLLDEYGSSSGAWATFNLISSGVGSSSMTVRRDSDDSEDTFTNTELIDGTLETFCAGASGFVKSWTDFSGSGKTLTQTTNSFQPKIVNIGVLIMDGAVPALEFDGINDYMSVSSSVLTTGSFSVFCPFTSNADNSVKGIVEEAMAGNKRIAIYSDTRTSPKRLANYAPDNTDRYIDLLVKKNVSTRYFNTVIADGTTMDGYVDGIYQGGVTQSGAFSGATTFSIGVQVAGSLYFSGKLSCVVTYATDQSSNQTEIETIINSNY